MAAMSWRISMAQSNPLEQERAFGGVIDVLNAIGAVYAIWGGLAVVAYGEPRFTMDMDILLSPYGFVEALFVKRLDEMAYHVDKGAVLNALAGGYFNVIHLPTHIKTDFYVPQEPLLHQMLQNRIWQPFDDIRQAAYISADAAIVSKLHAYAESNSTRHLDDIASIVRIQGSALNQAEIDGQAARLGVIGVWRELWKANSP
jgi:hypothetical protein